MVTLVNRAKVATATTGTGTITLGAAESGYQTLAAAGVSNANVVRYVIEDGDNWEIGTGTYTASGTTLTRTVIESSNADAAITLTGSAVVFVGVAAEDILQPANNLSDLASASTARANLGLGTAATTAATAYATAAQGTLAGTSVQPNDNATLGNVSVTSLAVTGSVDGRDVSVDGTKLDTIETNADVTDAANVTAAGALMDSEVTNLAQVKAFSSADYATAAQGTLAANALPKTGGALTGAVTTNSTFDGVDIASRDGVLTSTTNTANAALPKAGGTMSGNIAMPALGTVDGRDLSVDGAKLDLIEANATADQTAAQIKTAYESNADTNEFSDAEQTKLAGIETGATADQTGAQIKTAYQAEANAFTDAQFTKLAGIEASANVTDATNVTAAGALMDSEVTNLAQVKAFSAADYATATQGATADAALPKSGGVVTGAITTNSTFDGRDVATDGTKLDYITVTQAVSLDQMEIDIAALANGMVYKGDWSAVSGSFPGAGAAQTGWFYYVSGAGTVNGITFAIGDNIIATTDNASATVYSGNWSKHDQTDAVTSVAGLNGSITKSALLSALNVEDGADVTDATNVTSSGALMDSEVTNLAQVKAFSSADYATAAQGILAANALPKSGGALTGAVTTSSTFDGRNISVDGAKLDNIEAGATSDQTGAQIKTAYEGEASAFTDAQFTKLGGIEALADVTDTANVTTAGALMDSEVSANLKTLVLPATTTISTFGASLVDDLTSAAARTTLGLGTAATTAATAYATAAQGTLAANALPKGGGAMTGAITTNSTFDGVDIAVRDGVLTSTTTTANAALPKAGGTMTGNITMPALGTVDGVDISVRDAVLTSTTTTANAALPKAGGALTGAVTTSSTFDGRNVSVDGAKLDGIAAGATNTVGNATHTGEVTGSGALTIAADVVDAGNLKVTGNGTTAQYLRSDGDGTFTWATPPNTTYSVGDGGLTQINFTSADNTKLDGIATGATNVTNNNQLTNGAGYTTNVGDITGVTAGSGITGGGTTGTVTVSHADTSTQASLTALTGAAVVSDIDLDTYGHVTSLATRNLTLANLGYTGATNANNYSFPYTVSATEGGNTVVQRNSSGYLHANYFNGSGTFATSANASGMGRFTGTNGTDTYGRSYTAAAARTLLNVADGANNTVTNATHTGEVTGSGALTIAADVVDEANLKVSNGPTNGYALTAQSGNTGGLTWASVGGATFGTSYSTPSRAGYNTAHQNNTSNHRIVYLGGHGSVDYISCSPNNSSWYTIYNTGGGTGNYEMNHTTIIVPPGHYWRFSGSSYSYLVEIT